MATLLVSAAANLALGFALNALFPPDDQFQEGPRLNDLGFTSAAYGKFVNIVFGTDRVDGNVIETTTPAIEERTAESVEEVGKGGGYDVTTRSYSYFFTGDVAFAIEGAGALVRLWGDGKMIYDATGTTPFVRGGTEILFYPGGVTQSVDPEEESRHGTGNTPAYRHLTRVKINNLALADFGNRIPNFTAEITYNPSNPNPFIALDEPASGLDVPGSFGGGTITYMLINPFRDRVYALKGNSATGMWSATASTLEFRSQFGATGGLSRPTVGLDGFAYRQTGSANEGPLQKVETESGQIVATIGSSGIGLVDDSDSFGNSGSWHQLSVNTPGIGQRSILLHMNAFGTANGSLVAADEIEALGTGAIFHTTSTADGFETMSGFAIPDHDRGVLYVLTGADAGTTLQIMKVEFIFTLAAGGSIETTVKFTELRRFTRGDPGDDFENSTLATGFAVDRPSGRLLISNGFDIVLYDPATDTILEARHDLGFTNRNNYITGDVFAFANTSSGSGTIYIIDPRTLETLSSVDTSTISWPGGPSDPEIHDESMVWEGSTQSMIFSRVDLGSSAPVDGRVLKLFINRVAGQGVGLDTVVSALCTSYQRLEMAGLETSDIDVSTLAGDVVQGYTINRRGSVRDALEPLRTRFFFDGVQSDWTIKFPKRGGSSVLTIPEEKVGKLRRGRDATDDPAIKEIRTQDVELPMRLSVRYRNKDIDYNTDVEHAKRHRNPLPTINSRSERTLDLPIVDTPTDIKQTAEKWLYTMWAERRQFKTIIPWDYLELDPTDVFNMGLFGETIEMRLGEVDVGQGWAMDVAGVAEDVTSFVSTIAGGPASGFNAPTIPSSLPTRLIFLDTPLLSIQDLQLTGISNAYTAFGAFEDGWPGATAYRSQDDVDFSPSATGNVEAAVARVRAVPGAWEYNQDSDFPNRFQEVVEGGTMTIGPVRRASAWASATELNVLNGANALAVITANGVEIVQFQDATVNDDNTIVLDRLLRGRLGTEDVADVGGMAVGDEVVLLTDSTGAKEAASIAKQNLAISLLDTSLFYRGVTIGTLLEDAQSVSFAYTGRDLQPYSVVHLTAVDTSGDLVVDWERRARGPFIGDSLSVSPPLNETIEQYVVTLFDGVDTLQRTVDDATTTTFTAAQLSAGSISLPVTVTVVQVSGVSAGITSPPTVVTST